MRRSNNNNGMEQLTSSHIEMVVYGKRLKLLLKLMVDG